MIPEKARPMPAKPPFRADHVGSLLRPAELRDARAKARSGAISPGVLKAVEERHVRDVVTRQAALGLRSITDGEFQRDFWHLDFMSALDGVALKPQTSGMAFAADDLPPIATVVGKLKCSRPIMADHFSLLKSLVGDLGTAKFTIPAPATLHIRGGRNAISRDIYPDLAEFWTDASAAYRVAIGHLAAAGCGYLQLDDVSFSYLCDDQVRENFRGNGDDPEPLAATYTEAINHALKDRPPGMTVTMHTCRGNFRSAWFAQAGYQDAVIEKMFSANVDGFFMEYDSERSGGFEPLRLLPKGKKVVLGLVTTKSGALESGDALKRRIDEASRYVPLEYL
ncbi:MAG: 5-methyltetrahydropteroyltriglutamate--homocysteine S-methyltransferase, partial [Burkholderiales bacterium]